MMGSHKNGGGINNGGGGGGSGDNHISSSSSPLKVTNKKKMRKTRDSDCCSVNFVKYVLHIFNIIFFVSSKKL